MKILVDMNFSVRWAEALKAEGFEAVHWSAVGKPTDADAKILRYAEQNDYIILTNDLDFSALLAFSRAVKPSVIQVRVKDAKPETLARPIVHCLKEWSAELEAGAVISIDVAKSRIHVLPLGEE